MVGGRAPCHGFIEAIRHIFTGFVIYIYFFTWHFKEDGAIRAKRSRRSPCGTLLQYSCFHFSSK